jgi:hypothetical protein
VNQATRYSRITAEVERVVTDYADNDRATAAYLVARAALLIVRAERGNERASETAFQIADELATAGGAR